LITSSLSSNKDNMIILAHNEKNFNTFFKKNNDFTLFV